MFEDQSPKSSHASSRPAQDVQTAARKLLWFKLEGQAGAAQAVQVGADARALREVTVAVRQGASQRTECSCTVAVDAVSSQTNGSAMTFHSGLQVAP